MKVSAGLLLVTFVGLAASVFVAVLLVVALVKVLQIAEDLRYLRSKSDLSVERPKTVKNTLAVCAIATGIILVLMFSFALGVYNGNSGLSLFGR